MQTVRLTSHFKLLIFFCDVLRTDITSVSIDHIDRINRIDVYFMDLGIQPQARTCVLGFNAIRVWLVHHFYIF